MGRKKEKEEIKKLEEGNRERKGTVKNKRKR
jgi:hypothetical protein